MNPSEVTHKSVDAKFVLKAMNDAGEFEGFASAYTIDQENERIAPGAFKRTLDHTKGVVPILFGHSTNEPCGWNLSATEVEGRGLQVNGKLTLETEIGKKAYYHLKGAMESGGKAGLSIGFRVIKDHWETLKEDDSTSSAKKGEQVRVFDECSLLEYSVCVFPANLQSYVTAVKSKFDADQKQKLQTVSPVGETKDQMADKKPDFQASLDEQSKRREMSKQRGDIEDALHSTLQDIHAHPTMPVDEKKSAVMDTYKQYAAAMGDWHCKAMFAESDDNTKEINPDVEFKSEAEPFELKGIGLGVAKKSTLVHALDLHKSAMDLHKKAMKLVKGMIKNGATNVNDGTGELPAAVGTNTTSANHGTEMGAMEDTRTVEQKAADELIIAEAAESAAREKAEKDLAEKVAAATLEAEKQEQADEITFKAALNALFGHTKEELAKL